jgi:hypothetical protein
MSLFSSSSKTSSTGSTTPTNPRPVTDSLIDFTKLINSLGTRDPQQYVTGPSNLQNAAFSMGAGIANRYGAQPSFGMGIPQGQGGLPQGQMFNAYGLTSKPQVNGGSRTGSPDTGVPGQTVGKREYGNTAASMYDSPGVTTSLPISGGQSSGGQSAGGLYGQAGIVPETQYDYAGYLQANPDVMQHYNSQIVTPRNQTQLAQVGTDYDNDGRISAEEFARYHYDRHGQSEGRAITQLGGQPATGGGGGGSIGGNFSGGGQQAPGYSAATGGINPLDMYGNATGGINPLALYGDAANMTRQGAGGPNTASTSLVDQTPQIDPVTRARASRGIQFSEPYENRYTDQVVDTTLANFDEFAGRQRAAEAAQAAGNNAFGGSRFGVQRAITEEQIARERASQESGLRFGAQDRAFSLGMQDAGMATQASAANAAAANQRAQAQAGMDFNRLLANMGASNDMSRFNAGQADTAQARQLAAAGQLAGIGSDAAGNERADLAMLAGLGEQERGINQQQSTADLQLMQLMAQLYGTMPYGLFSGQNSTQTQTGTSNPSVLSVLGSGAMGLGSLGWNPFGTGG